MVWEWVPQNWSYKKCLHPIFVLTLGGKRRSELYDRSCLCFLAGSIQQRMWELCWWKYRSWWLYDIRCTVPCVGIPPTTALIIELLVRWSPIARSIWFSSLSASNGGGGSLISTGSTGMFDGCSTVGRVNKTCLRKAYQANHRVSHRICKTRDLNTKQKLNPKPNLNHN